MIDVHSHILPNIDDGSRSIDETFNLINEAKKVGFNEIICTSHYMENYYETDRPEREVWIKAIGENIENKKLAVKLYLGNEIYMTDNIIKLLEDGKATTMNDTSYVLFELPRNAEPLNLYDMIYEMQQYKIVPILAHPERYTFVQTDPDLIYDLVEKGVLMQSNYGSVIGQYGKRAQIMVTKMLENNMVHFLGTDVHRQNTIYPMIPEILSILKNMIGEERVNELTTTNPRLLLNNQRIDIRSPHKIKFTTKEKFIIYAETAKSKIRHIVNNRHK